MTISPQDGAQTVDAPVIAVDLDDVLSGTNQAITDWHNRQYGTDMKLEDFHYYHYWKNPYWGTPPETQRKVDMFCKTDFLSPRPVPGAAEGARALLKMGFRLAIVTARQSRELEVTQKWIDEHFPDTFDELVCTGDFLIDEGSEKVVAKSRKAAACHKVGARLLIDDSVENALSCAGDTISPVSPPISVLLFGDYSWNQRVSRSELPQDQLSYAERLLFEEGKEWWKDEHVELPENIIRAKDWTEVVAMVGNLKENGYFD